MGWWRKLHVIASLQSIREMLDSSTGSVEGLRFFPGARCVGERLCPHVSPREMIGKVFQMCIERGLIQLFHCLSKGSMQDLALTPQQLLVDGVAGEGMAKGKLLS